MAGEVGHIPVDPAGPRCACGAYGCLEAVASGPAIAAYADEVLAPANETLTTLDVYALAAAGDQGARHVVGRAGHFLSRAIYLLVMTYDVDKIVLGGGVTRAGDAFRQPLEKALDDLRADSALAKAMLPGDKVLTLPPSLNAGAYGALLLVPDTVVAAVE
jgi:predicted NBD/HSP70 family sugar kinase